ncbi:precorrin-3B C(17)-methyltransferase [Streptomyces sp.]|uniref:precorrin-3B C(17)-methyltransferase n=1 Tax=Streptomyces sp. TaxID=1931 RepID=UPI002811DD57|nr:precorrin-3B C(17)-methyltransferase [Streptomyces sp.]
MSRPVPRTATGTLLLAGLVLLGGCADPADDPRTSPAAPAPGSTPYCPAPMEPPLAPGTPCISQDPNQKYAENHGYRRQMELTPQERAGARGAAERLGRTLSGLAAKPVGENEIRAAAAAALGLSPDAIEYRAGAPGPGGLPRNIALGGGTGKVCVNGLIGDSGTATAEVAGRTLDGTCLPGLGGH